jgi:hypothetical protein
LSSPFKEALFVSPICPFKHKNNNEILLPPMQVASQVGTDSLTHAISNSPPSHSLGIFITATILKYYNVWHDLKKFIFHDNRGAVEEGLVKGACVLDLLRLFWGVNKCAVV